VSGPARPVIGLTGGIGSGKSAAAARFATHGIAVIDTDAIAHALTAPDGAAIGAIREAFGTGMIAPDGALDRSRMRALVFSRPSARHELEAILHPMIRQRSVHDCMAASSPYVILAVPLLIESGSFRERCTRVCVVDCPEDLQVERVHARSGLDEAQVRAIIAAQIDRKARLAAADDIIDNSGSLANLNDQVDRLHCRYMTLARDIASSEIGPAS
jgi:dephospho-CoA kinase